MFNVEEAVFEEVTIEEGDCEICKSKFNSKLPYFEQ